MKTQLYWTVQHLRQGMYDLHFAAACWWLSQRVDFLEWCRHLEALMPQPIPVSPRTQRRSRYALCSRQGREREKAFQPQGERRRDGERVASLRPHRSIDHHRQSTTAFLMF